MSRNHSDFIQAYMDYSAFSEATDAFHFWACVSTIAGALRRRCWLDMGYFEWAPNFYIIFVAPPGIINKTTTVGIGMDLLREVKGINFGPDVVTWQSLITSMAAKAEAFDMGDGTYSPMAALTCAVGELGTFLDPTDRAMLDVLVSLWDSRRGPFSKETKTQGNDEIMTPWLNMIACTTPAWLAGNFPEYAIGGGFASRTIFVYGEEKRQLVAYPMDCMPDDMAQRKEALIEDLRMIAQMVGPFTMTPNARAWGNEWYVDHHTHHPEHLDGDRFGGYIARKQSHVHKLAMILSAAQSDNRIITEDHLIVANQMVSSTELDLHKVFGQINADATKAMWQVVGLISQHPVILYEMAYRRLSNTMSYESFKQSCIGAQAAGYLTIVQTPEGAIIRSTKALVDRFSRKAEPTPYDINKQA